MAGNPQVLVTLVLCARFPLLSLAICTESLRLANRELGRAVFSRMIVTETGKPALSSSGIEIAASASLADINIAKVAIVLSSYEPEGACTPALLAWLRRQDRQGALLGCVDTGAYVLARAGILHGRHVTAHHESLPAYEETFKGVLVLDRIHIIEDGLASSAGGMATLDMMLALIASFQGEALADRIAFILNYRRLPKEADSLAASGDGAIARSDKRLGRMIELMQSHLEAPLPLETICRMADIEASTARRLFLRRFQLTPSRYYIGLRLNRARSLLANSSLSVREIATMVGFADASAFTRAFRRRFGTLPSAARHASSGAEI